MAGKKGFIYSIVLNFENWPLNKGLPLNRGSTVVTMSSEVRPCNCHILFVEAPQISFSKVESSYTEGLAVSITCTASGKPDPDVQWIRNGNVESSVKKTAVLTFSSINRTDDGQYTCKANNSAGNDEKHVTLVVHCK